MGMETTDGRFSGAMRITASDTDPAQITVQNKSYIIGNSTMDLPNDVIMATISSLVVPSTLMMYKPVIAFKLFPFHLIISI